MMSQAFIINASGGYIRELAVGPKEFERAVVNETIWTNETLINLTYAAINKIQYCINGLIDYCYVEVL